MSNVEEWGVRNIVDRRASIVVVLPHGSYKPILTGVPIELALQIVREHEMLREIRERLEDF